MSTVHETYQLRGYVRKSGYSRLETTLGQCAILYNAALRERPDAYRMKGEYRSYIDQAKELTFIRKDLPEWEEVAVGIGRGVLRRVDGAYNSFFRRVKAGQTPGFPRFKPRQRYTCIDVADPTPAMVKHSPDGSKSYIRVKGLPVIQLRLKGRSLPPSQQLKSLRIVLRPNGVMVDLGYQVEKEPLHSNGKAIGIDLGVNNRIALSNGRMVDTRQIDRRKERRLRRAIARARKGSNSRRKKVKTLSRESRRNQVRNRNQVHRLTTGLIKDYDHIAMERLVIPNLTRSARGTVENPGINVAAKRGLTREIQAQTWGLIRQQLRYKAGWAGRELVEVDPKYTSRVCNRCGRITPQSEYRIYRCAICGQEMDRDTNAALNILNRAFASKTGAGLPPSAEKPAGLAQNDSQITLV